MPVPPSSSFDSLLAHASFVRSLARELSRDASRADDLVQRTWLAALQHPPGADQPLRRWLAAILRNLAREEHRTETRRTDREALTTRQSTAPESDTLAEQIEQQRSLLRAVSELAEPYRSVIYQRYYEGLAPREIAARSGVPLKTVKTQLHRGLDTLRARLDREHGDRSAWLLAFIPLTGPPSWTGPALGALLVDLKLKVTLVCIAVLGTLGGVVFVTTRLEPPVTARVAPPIEERALGASDKLTLTAPSGGARQALEAASVELPANRTAAAAPELRTIRGRVIDLERRPVAGIEVVERDKVLADAAQAQVAAHAGTTALATSAADGTFELATPEAALELQARSPGYVTVLGAHFWSNDPAAELIIAVAPRRAFGGVVVDPAGTPVSAARVEIALPDSLWTDLGEILDHSFSMVWKTTTDERGRFELLDAPGCVGELRAASPAFATASIPLPEHSTYELVLRLGVTANPHLVVRGVVVDPHGAPVARAHVALGEQTVLSAADGSFELDADIHPDAIRFTSSGNGVWDTSGGLSCVRAVKGGHLPAVHRLPPLAELRTQPVRDPIRLELGGAPLSIEGRVEDDHGEPIANVAVWPVDGTSFGRFTLDAGHEGPSESTSIEAMLRGGPHVDKVRTDENGRFVLDGLCEREYTLAAFDAPTMRAARLEHVRAGQRGVVFRLRPEAELVRIGGRVVTESGAAVAGVRVVFMTSVAGPGTSSVGPTLTTDSEGRFGFQGEAHPDLCYQCSGESIFLVFGGKPEPEKRLDELEIVVWLRCHLQVDLGARGGSVHSFKALDARGTPTPIMAIRGGQMSYSEWENLGDGKSRVVSVRDSCKTLVYYDTDGAELGRAAIVLKPGELNEFTW